MDEQAYWSQLYADKQSAEYYLNEKLMKVAIQNEDINLFKQLKPKFGLDGNQWYVLHGENLQDGIAGFGDTLMGAILNFNAAFHTPIVKS